LNNEKTAARELSQKFEVSVRTIQRDIEHLWFGTLLSLGDGIEIKAPEHIRNRVLESAKKIVIKLLS
jgi:predicted DNA-binding transcriptional regulator YafY